MSEIKRAVNIVSAYAQQQLDRIRQIDMEKAQQDLDTPPKAWSKSGEGATGSTTVQVSRTVFDADHARKILQVTPEATFEEIRKSYDKFRLESDPSQYEPKSAEYKRRIQVQTAVHKAYTLLTEEYSITVKRFQSLELD